MFVRVWAFRPRSGREQEFEAAFGPHGSWAELFQRGSGFLGTELHRDTRDSASYLTIDRWVTAADFDAFMVSHRAEYDELDLALAALTELEASIGDFETLTD